MTLSDELISIANDATSPRTAAARAFSSSGRPPLGGAAGSGPLPAVVADTGDAPEGWRGVIIRTPWTVDIWQNGIVMSDGQNEDVAEFYYDEKHGVSTGREEAISRATLCAAAPEMLEALEEIAKGEGPFSRDVFTHACNTIESMKEIARKAIAAARTVP